MYTLLIVISTIVAALLIIMVLMQASKGSGLAGTFGGAGMGTMFGTRRTADFLSKGTWWLAGTLVVLAVLVNLFFLPGATTSTQRDSIIQGSQRTVPTQPTVPQQTPQQQNP